MGGNTIFDCGVSMNGFQTSFHRHNQPRQKQQQDEEMKRMVEVRDEMARQLNDAIPSDTTKPDLLNETEMKVDAWCEERIAKGLCTKKTDGFADRPQFWWRCDVCWGEWTPPIVCVTCAMKCHKV